MYTFFGQAEAMRSVRKVTTNIGQTPSPHRGPAFDLRAQILDRMNSTGVWTPNDFLDMGSRAAVDKVLQRLATSNTIRRIDRGLYDVPRVNRLTGKPTNPDYRAVIDAVARRDKARLLVDGITVANQLGLTNAVPSHVTVHTDARLRPIQMDQLRIDFKLTAPSRLYWAGRPAGDANRAGSALAARYASVRPRLNSQTAQENPLDHRQCHRDSTGSSEWSRRVTRMDATTG
jgi:hypothetical protein